MFGLLNNIACNSSIFFLCHFQVNDIVALWHKLLDYDKEQVVFAARQQDTRLTTGRFKKKAVFTPGVESLKQCVLGSTASPALWPDCCRLVEAIFISSPGGKYKP